MAKKSEQTDDKDIEIVEQAQKQKKSYSKKPQIPTKLYTVKNRINISGQWKEKGDKIKLTEKGFRFFRSKNIV